jgi:hypothetical protein
MKGEITWAELSRRCGNEITPEKTTVTKKTRRIAEWDDDLFRESCILNAPTEIALMFCDYIDPTLYRTGNPDDIYESEKISKFVAEHIIDVVPESADGAVIFFGTGPDTIVDLRKKVE